MEDVGMMLFQPVDPVTIMYVHANHSCGPPPDSSFRPTRLVQVNV